MYDVFISYRRGKGSDLASYFDSVLQKKGFTCFFDVDNKYSGDFMSEVEEAIKKSNLVVILVTEGSLERFVNPEDISRREIEYALKHNVDILPISVIGEEMFRVLDEVPELPECATILKKFNTRLYKHELKTDTINYLTELLTTYRMKRFSSINSNIIEKLSQHNDEFLKDYLQDVEGKLIEYKGRTLSYTGLLKFGKPHGQGTLTDHSTGTIYRMDWDSSGEFLGTGDIYQGNDLVYTGEINELEYDGQGILRTQYYVYEGLFREGKKRGQGTMTNHDGTVYTGEWLSDFLYARGYIRYPNKDEYWGKTNYNIPNGYGIMIKADGTKFDGHFRNGKITQGAKHSKFNIFIGDFEDQQPDGRGAMYDLNFDKKFEGKFKNGNISGHGKLYLKGHSLMNSFVPVKNYLKLKEFYPNFDKMNIILTGHFNGSTLTEYQDYIIEDQETRAHICEGYIRDHKTDDIRFTIKKDYKEVFTYLPQIS